MEDLTIDSILRELFDNNDEAFVVQIGAHLGHDPVRRLLREREFVRALLVEPVPHIFTELVEQYPGRLKSRVTFENVAIANSFSVRPFFWVSNSILEGDLPADSIPKYYSQLGSFDRNHILKHNKRIFEDFIVEEKVRCIPLQALFEKHSVNTLDLFYVDVEGYDAEVVMQLDLNRFQPRTIIFEHKHLSEKALKALTLLVQGHDYTMLSFQRDTVCIKKEYCEKITSL